MFVVESWIKGLEKFTKGELVFEPPYCGFAVVIIQSLQDILQHRFGREAHFVVAAKAQVGLRLQLLAADNLQALGHGQGVQGARFAGGIADQKG